MHRLGTVSIFIYEDIAGRPYVVINGGIVDDPSFAGAVELKLWADDIEVIDSRRK